MSASGLMHESQVWLKPFGRKRREDFVQEQGIAKTQKRVKGSLGGRLLRPSIFSSSGSSRDSALKYRRDAFPSYPINSLIDPAPLSLSCIFSIATDVVSTASKFRLRLNLLKSVRELRILPLIHFFAKASLNSAFL